ncbi:diguanylate cyclase [Marinobacterium lacunae]|uniref:Diguanylate cyclase n=1 Tax=Marinobacterium lacunae TaxID=1232683 RepID=A0A081FW17_9GAMM|nr:diguanylate cyclase [Marinobacterium lacunae]
MALIAVVFFLIFDFAALALNVWLSMRIEEQALNINLAGRQRMLTQRMVKSLLQLDQSSEEVRRQSASLDELADTFNLFDKTLTGFVSGGSTRDGLGREIYLKPLKSDRVAALALGAQRLWQPYRAQVVAVLKSGARTSEVKVAVELAERSNLNLLDLMNTLTAELEAETRKEARYIRAFQGAAFLLAILNFAVAIAIYLNRIHVIHQERDLIDSIIDRIASGVLVVGAQGKIIRTNESMEMLTGYGESELAGLPVDHILRHRDQGMVVEHRDGQLYHCSVDVSLAQLAGKLVEVYTVNDVTEQKRTENELSILAYHDQLTGLPNRLLFDDRLKLELNHCRRHQLGLAVVFIDLDGFKPVNDNYGHDVGDLLLKEVADRLDRSLRSADTVSRRGGDEFTLILTDLPERQVLDALVSDLVGVLTRPYLIEPHQVEIGASVGVSIFPDDGDNAQELIRHADEAMYWAKRGAGRVAFWSDIAPALVKTR